MRNEIGYKQVLRHENEYPNLKNTIQHVSDISKVYAYKHTKKEIETVLKSKPKYQLNIIAKIPGANSNMKHTYLFSSKTKAEKARKEYRLRMFDDATKTFRNKIENDRFLTTKDEAILTYVLSAF